MKNKNKINELAIQNELQVSKKCEHTVKHKGLLWYNWIKCDKRATHIIHYTTGDKLACAMHAYHYRKRATKRGWELPENISC